ncbi:glycosyltransferase family 2 protein [Flavihumibacter solisilvae]|uniref:glycosyltransferase family 2 protein n=1 Tax=Flavihumibacter solisilvae TaxID=1349421 RepID=UPI00068DBD9C|nr:glycosyltransferase family 2 protein [Flavihumibacter solisilvae]
MTSITGLVITFNEAKIISTCLDALQQVCDEIIVVDSFSSDDTVEICSAYPIVKVIRNRWPGFGPQKNFGATQARFDHILSVDADEVLSPELIHSIMEAKSGQLPEVLWLTRLNNYYGKFLYHGLDAPEQKPRIYDRRTVQWNLSPVHEELEIPLSTPRRVLDGKLWHYTISNLGDHLTKQNKYTSLAVQKMVDKGKRPSLFKLIFSPFFRFIKAYFLKLGLLDGSNGFIVAIMHSNASFQKHAKLWQHYYSAQNKPDQKAAL